MTYSIIIEKRNSDPQYVNDIETWDDVLDYLKNRLDKQAINARIYKWSSNNRCLGEKLVTMSNMWFVLSVGTDKVLL
jgi:hypothetical protein